MHPKVKQQFLFATETIRHRLETEGDLINFRYKSYPPLKQEGAETYFWTFEPIETPREIPTKTLAVEEPKTDNSEPTEKTWSSWFTNWF